MSFVKVSSSSCLLLIHLFSTSILHFLPFLPVEVNEPHEGLRKTESQWPVHQINWQKSRYVYDMFYTYHRISREVYDFCIKNKLVDAALIAKWKKPGYERLCSTYVINPKNYKFGTVSICRVPSYSLTEGMQIEDPVTGCRGCASGPGGNKNIFGNKYGQYLAAIQIAREAKAAAAEEEKDGEGSGDEERKEAADSSAGEEDSDDDAPVGAADGSSGVTKATIWARKEEEDEIELPEETIGVVSGEAEKEGRRAAHNVALANEDDGPPTGKRQRRG
jgi:bud site selection protein 31